MKEHYDLFYKQGRAAREGENIVFFYLLSDESLKAIEQDSSLILNPDRISEFLKENGDNMHVFGLFLDGSKDIFDGIKTLKRLFNPKTISWWDRNMNKFFILEVNKCQYQR